MSQLPEGARYIAPPLVEVVCGVQFAPLGGFSSVHFGQFWLDLGPQYVRTEDHAPLPERVEAIAEPTAEVLPAPPLRRVFYVTKDENFLYQVQPTRFLSNWRRKRPVDAYPRFESAYEQFSQGWQLFKVFAATNSLGTIAPNQYELTYINHIPEKEEPFPIGIERYLPLFAWKATLANSRIPSPRSATLELIFPLKGTTGHLYVSAKHGLRKVDERNILVLEITARGPAAQGGADMDSWFAMAHESAVEAFKGLASPAAQAAWGWPE